MGMPPITEERAEELLAKDATRFYLAALKLSPVLAANENAHAAIADFCFNLGTSRYKASTLKRMVDSERWAEAQEELGKWVWGGGRRLPGLILRRQAEAALLTKPARYHVNNIAPHRIA